MTCEVKDLKKTKESTRLELILSSSNCDSTVGPVLRCRTVSYRTVLHYWQCLVLVIPGFSGGIEQADLAIRTVDLHLYQTRRLILFEYNYHVRLVPLTTEFYFHDPDSLQKSEEITLLSNTPKGYVQIRKPTSFKQS